MLFYNIRTETNFDTAILLRSHARPEETSCRRRTWSALLAAGFLADGRGGSALAVLDNWVC